MTMRGIRIALWGVVGETAVLENLIRGRWVCAPPMPITLRGTRYREPTGSLSTA